ncbi:F0F1 ATP synthase subunit gamma [Methylomonas rhizoryzae]|uniref:F0F1 ATP synthase subunit gamma n=1 Tax=Methylomonas rhizoryzae TaxID=2608981 RepID=UPI0012318697|nr:F0F1 ATP synthase subunit gamma [Methylomonas rhizoryzae]
MSQRREIEARLALYEDLTGILGAMRSFALAELRNVNQREQAQHKVMTAVRSAFDDLAADWATQPEAAVSSANDIGLLFGSVRGFCGSFNEDVVAYWRDRAKADGPLILLGERLHAWFDQRPSIVKLAGAESSMTAYNIIDPILDAIEQLRDEHGFGLVACYRDEDGARSIRLWPLPHTRVDSAKLSPLTYAPPAQVAAQVAEHYLYHSLLALLLNAIRVENHMRLLQMETALHYLDQSGEDLHRQRNRLRQEEIVEEIELMLSRR